MATAFTLVELLIVIVVIGVLAAILIGVGGRIHENMKANTTRNTMRTVELAIDQFAAEDPLRSMYDNSKLRNAAAVWVGRTFGAYPPYQLDNAGAPNTVSGFTEPYHSLVGGVPVTLQERLARDLSGSPQAINYDNWADVEDGNDNDDIRALYAYLAAYASGTLTQLPDEALEPLPDRVAGATPDPEAVNPRGAGTDPGDSGAVDVLGIHDAWGVPLDYFLHVKAEWTVPPDGGAPRWIITDRVPVLRSRGVSAEEAGAGLDTPGQWIFSQPFPQPAAGVNPVNGQFTGNNPNNNGWARAKAAQENYSYVPEQ